MTTTTVPSAPAPTSVFSSEDKEKFRTLRITHLAAKFEELISDDANDRLTPEQVFLAAVDDALDQRRVKNIQKLLLAAQLPIPTASIAEINYQEGHNITPARMARYGAHDWANETSNLLITSPTGGGKTYIACAIAVAACHNEHKVFYTRVDELARRLIIARSDGIAHQTLLNRLSDAALLIIDDFLTVGIDSEAANDLFAILANREHRAATMIASQTGPGYWAQVLPDRIAADSIVNRLANNARTINLGDIDMRRHQGEQARATTGYWE